MPKVSEQHAESRKRQIIDAAYRCFARKGFHQASMRDIYEEAGLSPGAVYHYFDGKDAIIRASLDFDYDRSLDLFADALARDDSLGALEDLLEFFVRGLQGAAALGADRVNIQGWGEALVNPRLHETLRGVNGKISDTLAQIVRKGQNAGQLDPSLNPDAVSRLLLSIYYGLELQMALEPGLGVTEYLAAANTLLRSALSPA